MLHKNSTTLTMKRLLIGLSLVIFLSLISIYIFVPRDIIVSKVSLINCNAEGATRMVLQPANWQKWWLKDRNNSRSNPPFIYNGTSYKIIKVLQNSVDVVITGSNYKTLSTIYILGLPSDTVVIQWKADIFSGYNPVGKIQSYQHAISIKNNMTDILSNLRSFLENKENIYGINIQKTSTTDTLLIAAKSFSPGYPNTSVIYNTVHLLQKFIAEKGALQTGSPMVNITKLNDKQYQYMVAIPTDKALKNEGNFFSRKMVKGNFLVTEVRGGINTVNKAMSNMQLYIADYKKTTMAIPFQSLVTDRSKEADTTKWITKVYFPIFY